MSQADILADLQSVERERAVRATDAALAATVHEVKAHQSRRFEQTYADLLASPRYAAASGFFMVELYGTRDFTGRDAQFAKIVPALVRLFPQDIVTTVARLAKLHALSEGLDTAMGRAAQTLQAAQSACGMSSETVLVTDASYQAAWQQVGQPSARAQQIELALTVGRDLDRLTRKPLLRRMLKLMRGPASAAGLGDLQRFLEAGFDTFADMGGAAEFLATISAREQAFVAGMFAAAPPQAGPAP